MANTLDQDMHALKEWLRVAWRYLADPCLTPYERRELRNYMKDAGYALSSGLKQAAARDIARRESGIVASDWQTLRFPHSQS